MTANWVSTTTIKFCSKYVIRKLRKINFAGDINGIRQVLAYADYTNLIIAKYQYGFFEKNLLTLDEVEDLVSSIQLL